MLRSIGAVVAGYLVIAIAIMVLFFIAFPDRNVVPSQGFMLFSLVYGFIFGVLGGYVCGLIAGQSEVKHAAAIAVIGIILSLVSMAFAAAKEPMWYQLANMVVLTAAVLIGGWLRACQKSKPAAAAQTPGQP